MGKDFINTLVPLLHKSWDNWNRFYNEIMRNARIIKESGIAKSIRIANGIQTKSKKT